jgi:hypothetical protein
MTLEDVIHLFRECGWKHEGHDRKLRGLARATRGAAA